MRILYHFASAVIKIVLLPNHRTTLLPKPRNKNLTMSFSFVLIGLMITFFKACFKEILFMTVKIKTLDFRSFRCVFEMLDRLQA